jgi:hypothetical protein
LYRFLAIAVLLDVKDIPQVGPLQWGWINIWADLQFIESEAIIGTMLILMRTHRVPSFSTHDGLIVPRSKADLAKTILAKEYRRKVGVDPMLTVEPENLYGGALDL